MRISLRYLNVAESPLSSDQETRTVLQAFRVWFQPYAAWLHTEPGWVVLILLGAFIHGLLYINLIPPWGHYDEPGHFEYAWLVANHPGWPQPGDFDLEMRRAMVSSMNQAGFYDRSSVPPRGESLAKPDAIGYSQVGDLPLYYFLISFPLRALRPAEIETQLLFGRLFSLLFYLLTVGCAYLLTREITPAGSPLRWMAPSFLAMLPGLAEFMTAFNNFPLAIGLTSLWIWLAVRLVRHGAGVWELVGLAVSGLAVGLTQRAAWIVFPLFPVVLLLTFLRTRRWRAFAILLVVGLLLIPVLFEFSDASLWIRRTEQTLPTRSGFSAVAVSDNALQLRVIPESKPEGPLPAWDQGIYQIIPPAESEILSGREATVGAWIWAERKAIVSGPGLNVLCGSEDHWLGFPAVEAGPRPKFVAARVNIPPGNCRLQIWLRGTFPGQNPVLVYYTGLVLAEGTHPLKRPPKFNDQSGSSGWWAGPLVNRARNPLAQKAWPALRPGVYSMLGNLYEITPSSLQSVLSLAWDLPGTGWYSLVTARFIFYTFWAKFGWGHIPLAGIPGLLHHPYRILLIVTLTGILGFATWMLRVQRQIDWAALSIVLLSIGLALAFTFAYGTITNGGALRFRAYIPVARYLFPAIVPIAFALNTGWLEVLNKLQVGTRAAIFFGFFLLLDLYALVSVAIYI